MARSKLFWNLLAKRYASQPISDDNAYQHKLTVTREYLTPESKVLEVGCGTGSTALLHAPLVKSYHATDYSEAMIEIARQKQRETDLPNLTFTAQSIEDINAEDGSYDVILALNILHLLPRRRKALIALMAQLKPGGHLIASTACLARSSKWLRALLPIGSALRLTPYVAFFSREDFLKELGVIGLDTKYKWEQKPSPVLFTVSQKAE